MNLTVDTEQKLYSHFENRGIKLTPSDIHFISEAFESEVVIKAYYQHDTFLIFKLKNGQSIIFDELDTALILKIRRLPIDTKLDILNVSEEEIESHLQECRLNIDKELSRKFKEKRFDKEWGEPINFKNADDNLFSFDINLTDKQILSYFKNGKISIKKAKEILNIIDEISYINEGKQK